MSEDGDWLREEVAGLRVKISPITRKIEHSMGHITGVCPSVLTVRSDGISTCTF